MKIQSGNIEMSSKSFSLESLEKSESINYWTTEQNDNAEIVDIVDISKESLIASSKKMPVEKPSNDEVMFELSEQDKNKIYLLEAFFEKLTGKKMIFKHLQKVTVNKNTASGLKNNTPVNNNDTRVGWGFEYSYQEAYHEQEKMEFHAAGIVKTQDGQEIDVSLQLNMSREFSSHLNIDIKAGDALLDPIVVNFDGAAPSLNSTKFVFDLDADGTDDLISFVNPGSGLLALDLNEDGVINNGKELFGPNSGNGFAELSEYDSDHNNWIDENDPIYDRLKIWIKDENGNDQLFALGQKGMGAIYLGNIDTRFSLKDSDNNLLGQMRASSIYLRNSGSAGTIHQIDLVK